MMQCRRDLCRLRVAANGTRTVTLTRRPRQARHTTHHTSTAVNQGIFLWGPIVGPGCSVQMGCAAVVNTGYTKARLWVSLRTYCCCLMLDLCVRETRLSNWMETIDVERRKSLGNGTVLYVLRFQFSIVVTTFTSLFCGVPYVSKPMSERVEGR